MSDETKYEVRSSDKFGRYLVARCALKAGEVILQEAPLVVGPTSDSPLICFQCHAPLADKFSCCAACRRAPVCVDRACANTDKSKRWHDEAECSLFSSAASGQLSALALVGQVAALTPLRCLLKRTSDPPAWQQLMSMEHHLDERRGTDIWRFHESNVQFIESLGLVGPGDDTELVQKLCGIIDVNSFEVRGAGAPAAALVLRGVYPRAALMAHHCVGNTHLAVGAGHALTVRAACDIAPGELIYNNYVDALQGTAKRQERLRIGKYFTCECERCLDPTELGTHLSSVACVACRAGLVVPPPPPSPVHKTHSSHISKDTESDSSDATSLQVNEVTETKDDCSETPNLAALPLVEHVSETKTVCNENGASIGIHTDSGTPNYKQNGQRIPHCAESGTNIADSQNCVETETKITDSGNRVETGTKIADSENCAETETKITDSGNGAETGTKIADAVNLTETETKMADSGNCAETGTKIADSGICTEKDTNTADSADTNDTKTEEANLTNGVTQGVNIESVCNGAGRDSRWSCQQCGEKFHSDAMEEKVRACSIKLASINKWDESELVEYMSKVSAVLSPRHYLVLEAAQALAGVLRARIHRAPRPVAQLLRTMIHLCTELLRALEVLRPGISRAKAITLYELQATSVRLAKKLFEAREMTAEAYMLELESGQRLLKRAVAMLVVEPSGSPEGLLCAHALEELRDLRGAARALADAAQCVCCAELPSEP